MIIKQFENKPLAQFSYAILSEDVQKIVLVDPARDPKPYYDFAAEYGATIVGVIETHPHADFISSHFEIAQKTGALIYTSRLAQAGYAFQSFDDGSVLSIGEIILKAINTPGHSPDSISIVLERDKKAYAVFTGDTLFIGDCGRPDLRETAGKQTASKKELAYAMYESLHHKLALLDDDVIVYPAHGAGSLCGKSLKDVQSSTIGEEKQYNWSLQDMTEGDFLYQLLSDQPFVPAYFEYDVSLNLKGATAFRESIDQINIIRQPDAAMLGNIQIVDARNKKDFKERHLPNSINLMATGSFETWLGTLLKPGQTFYLTASDIESLQILLKRIASIGYEQFIIAAFVFETGNEVTSVLDVEFFKQNKDKFTIIDVRNDTEVKERKIFPESIAIPLSELEDRKDEIPVDRPIVIHCAGGYRSAAGSSLLSDRLGEQVKVFDLSEHIKEF